MLARACARGLALASVVVAVAACQYSPDTAQRTIAYNKAIAESTNDLFLLNALRAMERQPTYYSRNQANTATASISPTLSAAFPWASSSQAATAATVNSNPVSATTTGFLNARTITETVSKAALSLTSGLTATESNQLTLSNLDDQPSMYGLMTKVSLQQMANYLNEGFNPEQLYLLYIANLTIPEQILKKLPNAVSEYCAAKFVGSLQEPILSGTNSQRTVDPKEFQQDLYCNYFFGGVPMTISRPSGDKRDPNIRNFSNVVFAKFEKPRQSTMEPACFGVKEVALSSVSSVQFTIDKLKVTIDKPKDSNSTSSEAPPKSITFLNDPALGNKLVLDPNRRSFGCFKEVLIALLALDFQPTDAAPKVLYRLPLKDVASNSRLFADLTQQGLDIALLPDVEKKAANGSFLFGVCKKADDKALEFSVDGYARALFALAPDEAGPKTYELSTAAAEPSASVLSGAQTTAVRQLAVSTSQLPGAIQLSDDLEKQISPGKKGIDCASAVDAWTPGIPKSGAKPLAVSYTPRSLESMVYYLGQIIRSNTHGDAYSDRQSVTFLNWRDPSWAPSSDGLDYYDEELFRVLESDLPPLETVAQASDAGTTFFVPRLCDNGPIELPAKEDPQQKPATGNCSREYPNHSSAQVLTLLNQIWGLNKTQTAAPIIPTVTVLNPG